VKDEVVARRFAQCEAGYFEVELGDGAEGCKHAAQWWVEVSGGVLSRVEEKDKAYQHA
jgi:hypothetical protein